MPSDLALAAENTWEGVSKLPDWQCKFPNWRRSNLRTSYAALSNHGVGLLEGLLDPGLLVSSLDSSPLDRSPQLAYGSTAHSSTHWPMRACVMRNAGNAYM